MLWAKRLLGLFLLLFTPVLLLRTLTPIYDFSQGRPFAGEHWYNPFSAETLTWSRANFHIHSRTWGGITNGYQMPSEIRRVYDSLGYAWIGISDYQRINPESPIPVYEHGWSIGKVHQLCFWATSVLWWDYPLWQTLSAKQHVLRLLRPTTPFLVVAHPQFRPYQTYTGSELAQLGGYDAVEVLNRYGDSVAEWDSALSSGHFASIIASDNAHDVHNPHQVMSRWTEVNLPPGAPLESLQVALLAGRTVGYKNRTPYPIRLGAYPLFTEIALIGDTMVEVRLSQVVDSLRLIGQGGQVRAVAYQTDHLMYRIKRDDTYLRAEAYTREVEVYSSPLVRGGPVRRGIPPIHWGLTVLSSLGWGSLTLLIGYLGLRLFRARRDKQVRDKSPVPPPE